MATPAHDNRTKSEDISKFLVKAQFKPGRGISNLQELTASEQAFLKEHLKNMRTFDGKLHYLLKASISEKGLSSAVPGSADRALPLGSNVAKGQPGPFGLINSNFSTDKGSLLVGAVFAEKYLAGVVSSGRIIESDFIRENSFAATILSVRRDILPKIPNAHKDLRSQVEAALRKVEEQQNQEQQERTLRQKTPQRPQIVNPLPLKL